MIIGICGKKGSGKSTLAKYFVNEGFEEYAIAAPIKQIAEAFGFDKESVYGEDYQKEQIDEKWGISVRHFLQKTGTELQKHWLEVLGEDFNVKYGLWLDIFMRKYDKNKNYVISDVRMPKEEQLIRELGGIIIKTKREKRANTSLLEEKYKSHSSETFVDSIVCDLEIDNDKVTREEAFLIAKKYIMTNK